MDSDASLDVSEQELLALAALDGQELTAAPKADGADRAAEFLRRFEALAAVDDQAWPTPRETDRAVAAATIAMRARLDAGPLAPASAQTAGRIGGIGLFGSGDWRRVRWPLAVAATLVVGLAVTTLLVERGRGDAAQQQANGEVLGAPAIRNLSPEERRALTSRLPFAGARAYSQVVSPSEPDVVARVGGGGDDEEGEVDELLDADLFAVNALATTADAPAFSDRLAALATLSDSGADLAAWDWDALDQ